MENVIDEKTELSSQTAEAEVEEKGENEDKVSLGKFKDVKSLLEAYNSLQSEFTKRCQRLKELEGESVDKKVVPTEDGGATETQKGISEEEKGEILKDYLKGVLGAKQKAVILDTEGVGVKTPVGKPKTVAEAGRLAQELLKQ